MLQFLLPIVVLGFLRDRKHLWEYIFHFHVCATVTLIGVALWPAACAFTYYGFDSLLDQTRFIDHFAALRAGTFREVRFDNIEGLITFPSFHVAGGLMVTWAFRRTRVVRRGSRVEHLAHRSDRADWRALRDRCRRIPSVVCGQRCPVADLVAAA